jgi:hypothetical protein
MDDFEMDLRNMDVKRCRTRASDRMEQAYILMRKPNLTGCSAKEEKQTCI